MSAAGETIAVTVRCKVFPNGEEIVQLPSTTTALQMKESYHEKLGLEYIWPDIVQLTLVGEGSKIFKDTDVLSASSTTVTMTA
jgi:hypothetical protein